MTNMRATLHMPTRPAGWMLLGALVALLAAMVTLVVTTMLWGDELRADGRLLPGTTIASVAVGGATADEAVSDVEDHLAQRLDATVTLTHGERSWETTARELGAETDVEALVTDARERTGDAGFADLLRMRWLGDEADESLEVAVEVPGAEVAGFVDAAADEIERDARAAEVSWADGEAELREARIGRQSDREAATASLLDALDGQGGSTVELPVEDVEPEVTTATAREVAERTTEAVDAALDHQVEVVVDGTTSAVTPRELGAVADVEPLLDAAFEDPGAEVTAAAAGDADADPGVELAIPEAEVAGFVDEITAGIGQAARDAELELSGDGLDVVPAQTGTAVDHAAAGAELTSALRGEAERVELEVSTVQPSVTEDAFDEVVVLRQGAREVTLYDDADAVETWPVAVGTGEHPTPTGTFTVGAMRYEPTWTNPSPDGWGADSPASIGPGPNNPLGERAINWNQGGADTLIRFHGTPDVDSIGEAESHGCVRMFNEDVIELYDLVDTGTMIVSTS